MTNTVAKELVYALRNDPHTQRHFSIENWEGHGSCGSIGCIAGTAIAMKHNFKSNLSFKRQFADNPETREMTYLYAGSESLGIPKEIGRQLFAPWFGWFKPVLFRDFSLFEVTPHQNVSHDFVEEIHNWAKNLTDNGLGEEWSIGVFSEDEEDATDLGRIPKAVFTPYACANALEQVAIDKQPFVNWKSAIEMA